MRALLAALLLLAPFAAQAQTPLATARPHALVEDQVIRLSDLFDNAGPRAATAIGPAPAPGRRSIVEAAQLLAIARAHGVAWRPFTPDERVVVERPGRAVPRDEINDLLRGELVRLGMDAEADLELPGFAPPLVPLASFAQLAIEAPQFDAMTQRFAATLVVVAEAMPVLRHRVAGRALATVPVVVATRRMAVGDVVGPADARLTRQRAERVRPGAAQRLEQVVGQQLRRPISTELAFMSADLGAPTLIARNEVVLMVVDAPGLSLTAQGRAMEPAARGATIPVMNLASRSIVEAQAIGPGRVRILAGATPLTRSE